MKKYFLFLVVSVLLLLTSTVRAEGVIRTIEVEGNQRIEAATVLSYIDLQKGDPFDQSLLDSALKSLYSTGLFADVSLYQKSNVLFIRVKENPLVNEIRFEGNTQLKSEDLKTEIQLRPRQVLTRPKVQSDMERLQEIYRITGRFSATVEPKVIKLDQNRVNLIFEITEGPETHISRISFIGNKEYSDATLLKVIRSKEDRWYRFWTSDDKYDPDRFAYDQELVRKFYLEHGYADFRVQTAVAELSPDRKNFFITFSIEEGDRYKIGNVDIETDIPDLDPESLRSAISFHTGEWYKMSMLERTITKMTTDLGNRQFAFVNIQPGVERNREKRTVDIKFLVKEGQRTFVENIQINGNSRTLDEVIRREMTLIEGDPFNVDKLKKSEQNIRNLGFFENVNVRPEVGSASNKTNVDIMVQEKSTGELSLGAGFSTTEGPLADFRIQERNFLGKGQSLLLATTLAAKRSEFDFSFTEPYFLKRDLSAGLDAFHITQDLQQESSYDSKRSGGALRLGYPLSEYWRQHLTYKYEENNINNVKTTASTFIKNQSGKRVTSMLSQLLTYDTRDSRLDPTDGTIFTFNTDLAGLGGQARYLKGSMKAARYFPVVSQTVFSALGEVSAVNGLAGEDVLISERFFMGGANLRGFADAGVGPRDSATEDALGGKMSWRSSLELSFPTGLPEDFGVKGHVYSDAGSLWSLDDSGATVQDDSSIRLSGGAGISWRSPMGPIRVDWSKALVKETYDKLQVFRFSFGTRF